VLDLFLSAADSVRASRTLQVLSGHNIAEWVLVGGLAIELHLVARGLRADPRPLNDIDFIVDAFERIPATLPSELLFGHVHPHAPQNKMLVQCVCPETSVRVDVFRAHPELVSRSIPLKLSGVVLRLISIEDLIARNARLNLDLAEGKPLPAKHSRDFFRLLSLVDLEALSPAWERHRKPRHPTSLAQSMRLLQSLIPSRKDLQIDPVYSRDVDQICPYCEATDGFPQADAKQIISLLGYC
jgi:hypothetical protein